LVEVALELEIWSALGQERLWTGPASSRFSSGQAKAWVEPFALAAVSVARLGEFLP
jgi:hypothetical protein